MRVERADVDKVKQRLNNIKRKIDEGRTQPKISAEEDYEARLAAQLAEDEIRKRRKKEEAEARKREKEEAELETIDPEIAAIMGFGKLGGGKK
jgi:U4/U6.U5 tri-snRNP component SNU23